jgi:hypothetical protein
VKGISSLLNCFVDATTNNVQVHFQKKPDGGLDYEEILVFGIKMRCQDWKAGYKSLLHQAKQHFEKSALVGFEPEEMNLAEIEDNLGNSTLNYCFLDDPLNVAHFQVQSNLFFNYWAKKLDILNNADRIEIVKTWLKAVDSFQKKLFFLCWFGGGMPCRGTEAVDFRLRNTETSHRNVFIKMGTFCFSQQYRKQSSIEKSEELLVRFVPHDVAQLLLCHLVHVYPVFRAMSIEVDSSNEKVADLSKFLFTFNGRCYTGDKSRAIINKELGTIFRNEKCTISKYRHWITKLASIHIKNEDIGEQLIGADDQAAHSANTAEAFYGRTNLDIPLLTNSALKDSLRFQSLSTNYLDTKRLSRLQDPV